MVRQERTQRNPAPCIGGIELSGSANSMYGFGIATEVMEDIAEGCPRLRAILCELSYVVNRRIDMSRIPPEVRSKLGSSQPRIDGFCSRQHIDKLIEREA